MMSRPPTPESMQRTRERLQRARSACADLMDQFGATPNGRFSPSDPFGSMTMERDHGRPDMYGPRLLEVDG